ncbi:histidine phosphatase family protein [uncultured Anaeromusa sp.]|uniref:histidine phosphatase family protein n=1 Tax=uncultured Anaeromusa sp. TaxID=673273 RepID=UPI0029C84BCD|nr:histidine phosphatase family protein [uncultured Anaeromusa sp.]
MSKLILVRHGETTWNIEMRYQGQTDISLTANGIEQAGKVAQRLADEKIAAVYSSDLSRAFVTAAQIAAVHGLDVLTRQDLREISFGDWEGMTYDSLDLDGVGTGNRLFSHPAEIEIPGGETFFEVQQRMMEALRELAQRHEGQTVVIVSHGAAIRTVLCDVLGMDLNRLWAIRQSNTAVNILEVLPQKVLVSLVNDVHHLR